MSDPIRCVNAGSSSLKFAVYRMNEREERLFAGEVEAIGSERGTLWLRSGDGRSLVDRKGVFRDTREATSAMFAVLAEHGQESFSAVGHPPVHGGTAFFRPPVREPAVKNSLIGL